MNRYDWMRVLTTGCKPPNYKNKKQKNVANMESLLIDEKENEPESLITSEINEDLSDDNKEDENIAAKKLKSKEKLAHIKKEEINHIRNINRIRIYGTDIPPPIKSFEELSEHYEVPESIMNNLLMEKYEKPTAIQMQAWPLLLKRREVLGCAPTGSGKTAAYLLPIIHHLKRPRKKGFRAVIVAPTRELAKQIVRESDRLADGTGIRTCIIRKVKESMSGNYFKKFDILVTTPNRLIYLLQSKEDIKKIVSKVEWLIVDESDKLFEEGKNGFRDQLATIFRACSGPNVLRAMFSATLSFDVEEWSKLNLNNLATVTVGTRNACPDVEQSLNFCGSSLGKMLEIRNILNKGYEIPCLIFVQTKERAKELYEEILLTNRPVRCIHSDMTQGKRDEIVKQFRERKIWILICTELMGRGIDFKGVNLVINYDFPPSIVSYVHRIGRTGRAGKKGKAITFWTMEDKPLLRSVAQVMKDSGSEVPDWILNLKSTSQASRKKFAKKLPDRGNIYEGMKDKINLNDKKRKSKNDETEQDPKSKKKRLEKTTSQNDAKQKKSKKVKRVRARKGKLKTIEE